MHAAKQEIRIFEFVDMIAGRFQLDLRVAAVKSTQSTWGLPSQVKMFSSQVAVDKIYLNRRHENISSRDFN